MPPGSWPEAIGNPFSWMSTRTGPWTDLGDLIIPETDTPGASAALVNRFIDHLLAAESREVQSHFLDSLAYLDGACMERYGSAFIHLSRENQAGFLNLIGLSSSPGYLGRQPLRVCGAYAFQQPQGLDQPVPITAPRWV